MSVIWLTGLSGSGKSTIAKKLSNHIDSQVVDGDVIRNNLSSDLKHGIIDKKEHYNRVVNFIKSNLNKSQYTIVAIVSANKTENSDHEKDRGMTTRNDGRSDRRKRARRSLKWDCYCCRTVIETKAILVQLFVYLFIYLLSSKYCFRLTVREGCVDILFYLKILSVLDKSDAYRQHTK